MNNKIIVVWGIIIIILVSIIYYIGITYQNEIKYISLKEEVKIAVKDYISSEKITKYPFKITTEELEEKGYLKELKLGNKLCAADIEVTKKVFKSYDIEFTCVIVEK